ncbi:MAG: carboxypeptidase-like regulatory domain-containing protein [Parabacteroides merdae]
MDRKVKLDVNNETLIPILDKLFRGTDVEYLIKNRQIIIRRNSTLVKNNKSLIVSQEKKNLTGKVLDDNGEPLPGAAIVVKGSTRGVTTDLDGSFDIEVLLSEILVFSF